MILLTRSELTELTGYRRPTYVRRWLTKNGIHFYIGADGWPRVLRTTFLIPENYDSPPQPNWDNS